MCDNKIMNYYIAETNKMYSRIFYKIRDNYNKLYNQEEAAYKRSSEYHKAKSKAYWNRPKEVIDREALEEQMLKLDYWVPRQNTPSKTSHITYSENAVDKPYEEPIGFKPSISIKDYFLQETQKMNSLITHSIWKKLTAELSSVQREYVETQKFIKSHSTTTDEQVDSTFIKDLITINDYFGFSYECSLFVTERVAIVTNGCKIIVNILEQNKKSEFHINVKQHQNQVAILGCGEKDIFTLPGIQLTYSIEEIWE